MGHSIEQKAHNYSQLPTFAAFLSLPNTDHPYIDIPVTYVTGYWPRQPVAHKLSHQTTVNALSKLSDAWMANSFARR